MQIPLYALYCRSVLGLRFREEAWFGRVVNMATGDDTTREITRYDLMLAAERARHSLGAMQALLADPDRTEPRSIAEFPSSPQSGAATCQFCLFYAMYQEELKNADLMH